MAHLDQKTMMILILFTLLSTTTAARRVWITTTNQHTRLRFCTRVDENIWQNRVDLRSFLETKLQRRQRLQFGCGKIMTIVRSSTSDENTTNDVFVKITWRPTQCVTATIPPVTRTITISANRSRGGDTTLRNDSKERIDLALVEGETKSRRKTWRRRRRGKEAREKSDMRRFVSMMEVEHQLANLENELVEQASQTKNARSLPLPLPLPPTDVRKWFATHFFAGFVTMAAATTVVCWLVAYRADVLCAEREEDDENGQREKAKRQSSGKKRRTHVVSEDGKTTKRRKRRGKNDKKDHYAYHDMYVHQKERTEKNRFKGELTTQQRMLLTAHNHRIERSVECLQELLAEAGEWGTSLNSHGQLLITCRGQILSLERTMEMASYTQDSEEEDQ